MAPAPVVTGISPKEGPPGTKVTVRGENFGSKPNDLVNLIVCGYDCTLSAEWKSANKIIATTGPAKGKGDIIITTRQGGVGSCLVQFRGYHETIGPTKESAVWVEEAPLHSTAWSRKSLSPTGFQQEDPLGLSVEGNDKKMPEDDLHELFPEGNGDLTSEQFIAGWFLLEHHQATNFDDLRAGLSYLRRKVESQKEGQLSFLKANVSSVMDQLDTLVKLKDKYEKDEKEQIEQIQKVDNEIRSAIFEANRLFEEVLSRRERADATRNALAVLQRYKFLFCLPSSIERNILKSDFDVIINDYARVKNLFGTTDIPIFKRVMLEIEERIIRVQELLLKKLEDIPPSLDDHIKVIRNLINLEMPGDPPWSGIECYSAYLAVSMSDIKDRNIVAETTNMGKKDKSSKSENKNSNADAQISVPQRVLFIEEMIEFVEAKFPDLWKLGQCYFSGELVIVGSATRRDQFKKMVLELIDLFCNLLRAAILPHTLGRKTQQRQLYGIWSNQGLDYVVPWLPHCLRYVRSCYSAFIRLDLPSDALDIFSRLIFDLRLHCVTTLFKQAAESVGSLYRKETWSVELNESFGGITDLPSQFENKVRDVLQTTHDSVLVDELREMPLLENLVSKRDIEQHIILLFTNFTGTLEALGLVHDGDGDHGSLPSHLIGKHNLDNKLNWEKRMLVVMCNCRYTSEHIITKLFDTMKSQGYPAMKDAMTSAVESLSNLHLKLLDTYLEQKCDPLVGTIESSMYVTGFDWDSVVRPTAVRPYAKEIIMNMIIVRSELFRIPSDLVTKIMCKITSNVFEELSRLMCSVKAFSVAGSIQARADILAIKEATKTFSTSKSNRFCKEALDGVPVLDKQADSVVEDILKNYRKSMKLQISCLTASEMPC